MKKDAASGNYNPVALRYELSDGKWAPDARTAFAGTLDHSIHMMQTASVLLDFGVYEPLVSNILDHGLPAIQQLVFRGQWSKMKKQRIWRKYHEQAHVLVHGV